MFETAFQKVISIGDSTAQENRDLFASILESIGAALDADDRVHPSRIAWLCTQIAVYMRIARRDQRQVMANKLLEQMRHEDATMDAESDEEHYTTVYVHTSPRTAVLSSIQHGWHCVDVGEYDLTPDLRKLLARLVNDEAQVFYEGEPIDLADASIRGLRFQLADILHAEEAERARVAEAQRERERMAEMRQDYIMKMSACPVEDLIEQAADGTWQARQLPKDLFSIAGAISVVAGRSSEVETALLKKRVEAKHLVAAQRRAWLGALGYHSELSVADLERVITEQMCKALGDGWTPFSFSSGASYCNVTSPLTPEQEAVAETYLGRGARSEKRQLDYWQPMKIAGFPTSTISIRLVNIYVRGNANQDKPHLIVEMKRWYDDGLWTVVKELS